MAPEVFAGNGHHSLVIHQPEGDAAIRAALLATLACPTASIGAETKHDVKTLRTAFPLPVDGPVHHCGYHAQSSFGAASWLIRRPEGNVMVDCPRFTAPLVKRLEELGGIGTMVLTHRDDVADHRPYALHFGCTRVLHADDRNWSTNDVEHLVTGRDPIALAEDLLLIPVPGHTRGSMCLLADETYLFTGDHLAWDRRHHRLTAFRDACWYDWAEQVASMRRLAAFPFSWVLPGHGAPGHLPRAEMAAQMKALVTHLGA
jgi:glyoxylase-like metal-dependent hydrolase (beta-lactamase superfamily II)